MKPEFAVHKYERNSRLILQEQEEFIENPHYNITLHFNGVESFKHSNIMCGIGKTALRAFGWRIYIDQNINLMNVVGELVGRFENYYGNRSSMGNQNYSNQPLLQRCVIKKKELDYMQSITGKSVNKVVDLLIHESD